VVFVTDSTQLEQQLGETGQSIGFTVKVADSVVKLKELLRSDSLDLVMAMIHKFRETELIWKPCRPLPPKQRIWSSII
jgi:type I restriction enzyme R subunit